jgi:solute carrier family 9 (sodium/hydrogen exchanger), member 8
MISSQDAAHEFGALNTLLIVVVLGLCILAAYLVKQNSFYYLPESAAAILVGLIVGGLARYDSPTLNVSIFTNYLIQFYPVISLC